MKIGSITISNYRSIPSTNPVTLSLYEGITFILGVNNIGKSNLIKMFYELRQLFIGNAAVSAPFSISSYADTPTYFENIKHQKSKEVEIPLIIKSITGAEYQMALQLKELKATQGNFYVSLQKLNCANNNQNIIPQELGIMSNVFSKSIYVGSYRIPFNHSSGSYFDISNGQDFITLWDRWANGESLTHREKIHNLKNELKELFGFETFEISLTQKKDNLLIRTENGSFRLDELGSGIGGFILVLANVVIKEPDFILIDEPENSLHPKLQEIFVRILATKAKYGLIATSHSIGLARVVADNTLVLSKSNKGNYSINKYGESYLPRISAALSELGFSQFVEIGGNNILLVEGATDIKVFKEILRKYGIEQHYIILNLGGAIDRNSIKDELIELSRMNANSYSIIIDSEKEDENSSLSPKIISFVELCKKLNINCFTTEYHSTENYIKQTALDVIYETGRYKACEKYENFSKRDQSKKWDKSNNWKMVREMNKDDFKNTKLENFIINVLSPQTYPQKS